MHSTSLLSLAAVLPLAFAQLHSVAKGTGLLYFGTETESVSFNDAPYQAALKNLSDFGQITPGNSMKWDAIEPQPNVFSFTAGDSIAKLAQTNQQILRCHNLVWHQQLPTWVSGGNWTKATLTAALQNHITTEVTHYKGQCYAWDVVNEALNDNGTFRNDVFFRVLGEDYIKIAFQTAAAADPSAKLYYNDFNTEFPGVKSTAAQGIVKMLKAANIKIDGVGFQAHFVVGGTPSMASQITNLQAFTALGVEVAITELDIRMTLPVTDAQSNQQMIDYQTTTSACVAVKDCIGVTVWDFDDKYSWVPSTFPGTGSACLFDENVVRKSAYAGAVNGLRGLTVTSTNGTSVQSSNFGTTSNPPNSTVTSSPLKAPQSGAPSVEIGALTVVLSSMLFAALLL